MKIKQPLQQLNRQIRNLAATYDFTDYSTIKHLLTPAQLESFKADTETWIATLISLQATLADKGYPTDIPDNALRILQPLTTRTRVRREEHLMAGIYYYTAVVYGQLALQGQNHLYGIYPHPVELLGATYATRMNSRCETTVGDILRAVLYTVAIAGAVNIAHIINRQYSGIKQLFAETTFLHESYATLQGYKDQGVEYYEYVAILDNSTTDICEHLNGKIFRVKDAVVGVNYPGMHHGCRSTTRPIPN